MTSLWQSACINTKGSGLHFPQKTVVPGTVNDILSNCWTQGSDLHFPQKTVVPGTVNDILSNCWTLKGD